MDIVSLFSSSNFTLIVVTGVALVFLSIEMIRYRIHVRILTKIPVRIHVNGSRGKSSVTRLIGAALRKSESRIVTKTTGTAPRFIMPDGNELPIFRAGKPNIIEQVRVVARAHKEGATTLVAECMAVTPEYIATLEDKIIQSTMGVITNIREDHLDVMGPTMYDVTVNIAKSLPSNGVAFTAEKKWFNVLETEAKSKGSTLIQVHGNTVSDEDMSGFSYMEHKENVALALAVADRFGICREMALKAMYQAQPDPGVLRETIVPGKNGTWYFFNALAANDPDSTHLIWNMACARRKGKRIAFLILRSDRIQRTEGFAQLVGSGLKADIYIVVGDSVSFVTASLKKKGVAADRIIALHNPQAEAVVETIVKTVEMDDVVVAMGNIVGLGEACVLKIENLARTPSKERV